VAVVLVALGQAGLAACTDVTAKADASAAQTAAAVVTRARTLGEPAIRALLLKDATVFPTPLGCSHTTTRDKA
jgi:5,10-methylene-tetrahydrofolate dehydrogenase/methenyl tetrahydrofolate cyclohydrolase